jgi:hypothetical protein
LFDEFIDVASVFDYIFTADRECVARCRQRVPAHVRVNVLIMPYQSAFHQFTSCDFTSKKACCTESYYRRILDGRLCSKEFLR